MAVIGINYSGCNFEYNDNNERVEITDPELRLKYESVYIHCSNDKLSREFKSGNFVKDWYDAKKYYINELQDKEPYLGGSSTCDHFFMDGAEYDSAYLHIIDDNGVLKYIDYSDPHWYKKEDVTEGIEFFVDNGTTPTWNELREICGDKKQTV